MTFTLTTMTDAIKQLQPNKAIIFADSVLNDWNEVPATAEYAELTYISSDAAWKAYSAIDFSSTTTVTMVGKKVKVIDLMSEAGFSKRELEKTWMGNNTSFLLGRGMEPYQRVITETIIEPLTESRVQKMFVGVSGTTSPNGIVVQLKADSDRVTDTSYSGTNGYTGFTYATAITVVDSLIGFIPEKMTKNKTLKLYMSITHFKQFIQKVRDSAGRYYAPDVYGENSLRFKYAFGGAEVEIVGTHALYGTNYMFIAPADRLYNIYRATDVNETMDFWYDINSKQYRTRVENSFVPSYAHASEIVCNF